MKDEDLNQRSRTDSEWNWINQHRGHYNRQEIRNFIGSERIRVTFSDKMEDNTDASENSSSKNHYGERMNLNSEKDKEKRSEIPVFEKSEKKIGSEENSKPEKVDGGEVKKDKPEIRYDLE